MKKIVAVAMLGLLTACAAGPAPEGLREYDLRRDVFFRGDQKFSASFAQVQQNLFQNRENCGTDFEWRLEPQQVNYSTVIYKPKPDAPLADSVLLDLTSYTNGNITAKAYSYYVNGPLNARQVLYALADPTICPTG